MDIKIGSRKSALALKQTEAVIKILKTHFPNDSFQITGISTTGDKYTDKALQSFNSKGIFIKEIESALLDGTIDMAVHSAKDMPAQISDELEISAALLREDRGDALIHFKSIEDIKIIGTGSIRRKMQAEQLFPNSEFKQIRGNIHTRVEKIKNGEYDAVIMAKAAINRLGINSINITDLSDSLICAAGQGILVVETVKGKFQKYTEAINDTAVMTELIAERTFLKHTNGGCHTPCGASAIYKDEKIIMKIFYSDNGKNITLEMTGNNPELLGTAMAKKALRIAEEK